jgi:predicted nucleic acid-binding protein
VRFVLDTNVLSDLRRGQPAVVQWARRYPDDDFAISAATLMELQRGVLLLERRDRRQGRVLRRWFEDQVVPEFDTRTLPVDGAVARRAAALHVPDPMPAEDAYIAATALVHGLAIVTRNTDDFASSGATTIDPWR